MDDNDINLMVFWMHLVLTLLFSKEFEMVCLGDATLLLVVYILN